MIPRHLLPILLGAMVAGCAAGQVAMSPADPPGARPDPHDGAMVEANVGEAVAAGAPPGAPPGTAGEVPGTPPPAAARIDFAAQVRPILKVRCTPCHFPGGQMYDRLPFDSPETIRRLGTLLFTRIKDEEERALIRTFLEQPEDGAAPPGSR